MDIKKLEQLCELKEKGLLTKKEFEEEKKKLLEASDTNKILPQKGICWKNVGLSLLITVLTYLIIGGFLYIITGNIEGVGSLMSILLAIVLTIIASKMKTGQYKNCASPAAVFICTLLLSGIACFLVVYSFLQIKDGNVILKTTKNKQNQK